MLIASAVALYSGLWKFAFLPAPVTEFYPDKIEFNSFAPVPGCFDTLSEYALQRGTGVYCRKVYIGGSAALTLEGVGLRGKVYWDGKAVDCEDTVDFIKFTTKEDCTLKIASTQWVGAVADIVAVNNVILKIADGFAETTLQANTEYTIKLERKESNSAAYTISLA